MRPYNAVSDNVVCSAAISNISSFTLIQFISPLGPPTNPSTETCINKTNLLIPFLDFYSFANFVICFVFFQAADPDKYSTAASYVFAYDTKPGTTTHIS